jgi:hypothetical protein
MFNSTVLEVAIGLVFCYASVALITSSIYEAIASQLNFRSKTLFKGIQCLLNASNEDNQKLLLGIYNHALASPLGDGAASAIKDLKNKPSYIDSSHFASALLDTIQSAPGSFEKLGEDINAIKDEQIKQLLRSMYDSSAGKIETLQTDLATWFDAGMDRVSGSYKRQAQVWCFVIALALSAVFNIDSFHLFKTLWQHPAIVMQVSNPETSTDAALKTLETLPIGWWKSDAPLSELNIKPKDTDTPVEFSFYMLGGWLVTASASLFGGPFWFDLLKQLINLRGTGVKPKKEAIDGEAQKTNAIHINVGNDSVDIKSTQ